MNRIHPAALLGVAHLAAVVAGCNDRSVATANIASHGR